MKNILDFVKYFKRAFSDILPLSLAVTPWGILVGSMGIEIGLTPWQSQAFSLFLFAGSAQISSLTILGGGGSWLSVLGSSTIINSRHLLYSAACQNDFKKLPRFYRMAIAFFITDEAFAVISKSREKLGYIDIKYAFFIGVIFYFSWNLATLLGIITGKFFLPYMKSLSPDFLIAATFIAISVPAIKNRFILISCVCSAIATIVFIAVDFEMTLIVAPLIGMTIGFVFSEKGKR